MSEETKFAALAIAKRMLLSTSKGDNEKSLFVYAPSLGSDVDFHVHGIMDDFPMPEESLKRIPDDKLIGLLVNGVEEVDLEAFKKYPNLMRIIIGKDVKRVVKSKDTEDSIIYDQDKKTIKLKEEGKQVSIKTDYLSKEQEDETGRNNLLTKFNPETMQEPNYRDIKIAFKVSEPNTSDSNLGT